MIVCQQLEVVNRELLIVVHMIVIEQESFKVILWLSYDLILPIKYIYNNKHDQNYEFACSNNNIGL